MLKIVVTQRIGNARLDTRHPHMADPVLVLGFYKHSKFYVPQGLHCNLVQCLMALWER